MVVWVIAGCGDNNLPVGIPLMPAHDLQVVAHQDDDLLFMQPDMLEAVRGGRGVVNVYVTAGNNHKGIDYAETRYNALRTAYRAVAGSGDFACGWIELAGHVAEHCRLDSANVSLVFLGYPDGGKKGEHPDSLLHLWEAQIDGADTIARRSTHYTRDELIETVAEIVREVQPQRIRTLEVASIHGPDHSDHMLVGALAVLASARANSHAELVSYRGYSVEVEPPNWTGPVNDDALHMLAYYEACTSSCAPCGEACPTIQAAHVTWLQRRYAVGFRRHATGRLLSSGRCLGAQGAFDDCRTAPSWTLDDDGELRLGDRCMQVLETGDWQLGDCIGGLDHTFLLDDEGHLWSSLPPTPAPMMDGAHLDCLAGARFELCGAEGAPVWEFAPPLQATPRTTLAFTATGRAVRLGDLTGDGLADLCAVTDTGLWCAPGRGDGTFAAPYRIDGLAGTLAIDPRSLTIGDVDGDGRADACGRDTDGVLCATAASGFAPQRWSYAFADNGACTQTSASLTAIDADADGRAALCGLVASGVICAKQTTSEVRSSWPQPSQVVLSGDLDGDGTADWCAGTDSGAACSVAADAAASSDGIPWSFALSGAVDAATLDPDTAAMADIDGDGRADLCTLDDARVSCARSQGRGFGPRAAIAEIPDSSALWLGDLDGDGHADACADTGATVTCVLLR